MKNIIFLIATFLCSFGMTQDLGLHFGHQMFSGFNSGTSLQGLSFGIDIPRSANVTPYGQISVFLPVTSPDPVTSPNPYILGTGTAINPSTTPSLINVYERTRTNHISIELGTIYYIGGAYDYGWSFMMQNSIRATFFPQKNTLIGYNPTLYDYNYTYGDPNSGSFLNNHRAKEMGVTLHTNFGIGAKYTYNDISFYGMVGLDIALIGVEPPEYVQRLMAYHTRLGIRYPLNFAKNAERRQERQKERQDRKSW